MASRKRSGRVRNGVFADTAFWIALLRKHDQYSDRALRWKMWADRTEARVVTSELVLVELLNALAHPRTKRAAAEVYRRCLQGSGIELVVCDSGQLRRALDFYQSHADKEWSLTDCHSFLVMRSMGITQALATDHHFEQAGFRALMREEPPTE